MVGDWWGAMKTFSERLASAREQRPTKDVQILFGDAAREREALEEQLKTADRDGRLGAPSEADQIQQQIDALDEASINSLERLRFTRLNGRDWAELAAKNPARGDVAVDLHYGYNFAAVCEAAAKFKDPKTGRVYAHLLEGDEPVALTDEEWDGLFAEAAGSQVGLIYDAIWELNEFDPAKRVQELVKASGAATRSDSK